MGTANPRSFEPIRWRLRPGRTASQPPLSSESVAPLHLLCRVGSTLIALPLGEVLESMRPLPVEPIAGAPAFVSGVALVRGEVTPVVDLGALLGGAAREIAARWVTIRVGDRQVALAVAEVLDVRPVPTEVLHDAPPLTSGADSQAIAALGRLDERLLVVLESARLVPESVWSVLDAQESAK